MKRKKHSESEMVKAVKKLKSGVCAEVFAHEYGVSKATVYQWKSKYRGLDISQEQHLKELKEEHQRLKQMYADLALDNQILKDIIEKNARARGQKGDCRRHRGQVRSQHRLGMQVAGCLFNLFAYLFPIYVKRIIRERITSSW